jgi:hypothetical protein
MARQPVKRRTSTRRADATVSRLIRPAAAVYLPPLEGLLRDTQVAIDADPRLDVTDDEAIWHVWWYLTEHECGELCAGVVPVRMKLLAEYYRPILAGRPKGD